MRPNIASHVTHAIINVTLVCVKVQSSYPWRGWGLSPPSRVPGRSDCEIAAVIEVAAVDRETGR